MTESIELPDVAVPLAYFNGQFIPRADVRLSMWDFGFTMGVTVTEQMRTFGGRIPFLDRHLNRLSRGLEIVGIDCGMDKDDLGQIATRLATANRNWVDPASDLGIGVAITPGCSDLLAPQDVQQNDGPTVLVYTYELPFQNWSSSYETGLHLGTVATRETPANVLPKELKCRSRMHYYLAERQAKKRAATEKLQFDHAILQDAEGSLAEGTIASIALVKNNSLVAPPESDVLPSVSFSVSSEILVRLGIKVERRAIAMEEVYSADEVLWFNATRCVMPVTQVDGVLIGNGKPGPTFQQLRTGWLFVASADFMQQAIDCSKSG